MGHVRKIIGSDINESCWTSQSHKALITTRETVPKGKGCTSSPSILDLNKIAQAAVHLLSNAVVWEAQGARPWRGLAALTSQTHSWGFLFGFGGLSRFPPLGRNDALKAFQTRQEVHRGHVFQSRRFYLLLAPSRRCRDCNPFMLADDAARRAVGAWKLATAA